MNEASSLTDTVLGSGRELHVQQLFPAAAFHLISADGRVDLALVIMHNIIYGFLISEGENCPLFPKQTGCQNLACPARSARWTDSSLLLCWETCSAPALPASQESPGKHRGAAVQGSFTECQK